MESIDFKSTIVAGLLGAVVLTVISMFVVDTPDTGTFATTALTGFVVGAGVQIGVRLTGVS